ncbi:TMEM175 family protein [Luteimicrobium sp. DT211]|uniref:TMEM175 family protein n=1 Tax=Luteimicrobium sp. DT211 TaxID=3393412 RepID=UPI003CF1D257
MTEPATAPEGPTVFRGAAFDRLLFFSDAVVAIAITLVVLPLVDSARELDDRSVGTFLSDSGWELAAAALTFVVVGVFWRTHHGVFADATGATSRAVTYNLVWLACVAFLPVPTVLVVDASSDDRAAHGLYIGTMLVAVVALVLEEIELERHGLLPVSADPPVARWITAAGVAVALVLAVALPSWSMWPVLVLVPAGWLQRWLRARAARPRPLAL